MSLLHAKSNTVADFTGTITGFNSQGSTTTIAASALVRPVDWNSGHVFQQTIAGETAGQSTASGTNMVYGGTNGHQVSLSTGAGVATLWMGPGLASGFNPYANMPSVTGQLGNASLRVEPMKLPGVAMDRWLLPIVGSNSTNSSGSHSLSFWLGMYTRTGSTLSLLTSTSGSTAVTLSGTVGSWSLFSSPRFFSIPQTTTFTAGQYWLGMVSLTSSGGANATYSNIVASNLNSIFGGFFGASHNTTQQYTLGQGVYSATTSGMPASIGFSQLRGSDSGIMRAPIVLLGNGTI